MLAPNRAAAQLRVRLRCGLTYWRALRFVWKVELAAVGEEYSKQGGDTSPAA